MSDPSSDATEPESERTAAKKAALEAAHGPPDSARLPRANRSVHGEPQQPPASESKSEGKP